LTNDDDPALQVQEPSSTTPKKPKKSEPLPAAVPVVQVDLAAQLKTLETKLAAFEEKTDNLFKDISNKLKEIINKDVVWIQKAEGAVNAYESMLKSMFPYIKKQD
jgi:hypothetical protein